MTKRQTMRRYRAGGYTSRLVSPEQPPKIMLIKANLRAWLIATPMVECQMWREYVDHMLAQFDDITHR